MVDRYECVNGHTFDEPIVRAAYDDIVSHGESECFVYACPYCDTPDIADIDSCDCGILWCDDHDDDIMLPKRIGDAEWHQPDTTTYRSGE